MNTVSAFCSILIFMPFVLNAQAITGDIPYAKKLLNEDNNGMLKVWTMSEIRNDKTETINPGGNSIKEKDIRSHPDRLGHHSLQVEIGNEDEPNFSGTLDLTNSVLPAKIAILVDDIAILKVKEIERKEGVEGPVFSDKFEVRGTALWNSRSYEEFSTNLPTGRKYQLDLTYSNTANLTPKYEGKIDIDGVSVYVSLLPLDIVPDWTRDGIISKEDRGKVTKSNPWRFWRNSDNDAGSLGGDDIQESDEPDCLSQSVDGVRDLVDFFPVFFDLELILNQLPNSGYEYYLKHKSQTFTLGGALPVPAFNVIWYPEAELAADPAGENGVGSYLKNATRAEDIAGRKSQSIPNNGLKIPDEMLSAIKNGKGIALFESRQPTDNPIFIEIRQSDGTVYATVEMPVRILEVESMIRIKFLNENLGGGSQGEIPSDPNNWPDAQRNGKHFIFAHGYNVSGTQARGWHAETFKRLFWSGSNAMFTGISWHGNESQTGTATADLWRNVHNAFQTSKSTADFVNALPGAKKSIAAHSLGNVLVSSAIKDHGLKANHFFIIDAAAGIEAFSPGSTLGNAEMSHPDWRGYDKKLWCSEWHNIFPVEDNRRKMTWRNRFGNLPNAYNFYSAGEEVLKNGTGEIPGTAGVIFSGGVRAWVKNEMSKGLSIGTGGGIFHNGTGGWDFNHYWDVLKSDPSSEVIYRERRTPAQAALIPTASLEENPFFDPFVNEKFHDPALGNAEAAKYNEVSKALAESLPSLTFAAGSNPIDDFNSETAGIPGRNYNMMDFRNGWPEFRTTHENADLRGWLHSDIRNAAYLYTYKVFEKFVELGGLKP